jgi:hypothetical protein
MQTQATIPLLSRRRSIRRAVRLPAEVTSSAWQEPMHLLVSNLSAHGLWLQCDRALPVGASIGLRFMPPQWHEAPLQCAGTIAWACLGRRRSDAGRSPGMGVRFVDMPASTCKRLESALAGLPPPLPGRELDESLLAQIRLQLEDGSSFLLRAESDLLSEPAPAPRARLRHEESVVVLRALMRAQAGRLARPRARAAGLMSAILEQGRSGEHAD